MQNDEEDQIFWQLSDEYIDLANEKAALYHIDLVNDAMMFSAARYNAFVCTQLLAEGDADKDQLVDEFVEHYRRMLCENIEEMLAAPPGSVSKH